MERFLGGLILALQVILGLAMGAWSIWFVVIGFAGGSYPVPWEWSTSGSVWEGLLWIFIGIPMLEGVVIQGLSLLGALIIGPFAAAAERRTARQ